MKNKGRKEGELGVQFRGPYTITEALGKGQFHLQDQSGAALKQCHLRQTKAMAQTKLKKKEPKQN